MNRTYPLNKVGFVMLGASDLDASMEFYRDRLGMEVANRNDEFVFLKTTGVTLILNKGLTKTLGKQAGPVEIVFSVDHVQGAYQELKSHGVEFRNTPRAVAGPMWAADFRDPDGHALSIFGPE
jgi:catechol 2,3-dioxygenase-like lactoylglutathione lyase family enzyme